MSILRSSGHATAKMEKSLTHIEGILFVWANDEDDVFSR